MNEKDRSLQHIMDVFTGCPPMQKPIPMSTKKDEIGRTLWAQYVYARDNYLDQFRSKPLPNFVLHNPLLFFYIDKSKKIHAIFPFPYGDHQAYFLTRKTFPSLLVNICNTPYEPGPLCDSFFDSLTELLRHPPSSHSKLILEEIKRFNPVFSALVSMNRVFYLTKKKNIYFDNSLVKASKLRSKQRYQPVLNLEKKLYIPVHLQKSYFSAFSLESKCEIMEEWTPPDRSLTFHTPTKKNFIPIQYRQNDDRFIAQESSKNVPVYDVKALPVFSSATPANLSDNIYSFFHTLCGSDLHTVDQLACFLTAAMSQASAGLTVLCVPDDFSCEFLKNALQHILEPTIANLAPDGEDNAPVFISLNKLTKRHYLQQMFLEQADGKGIVFVRDTLPSDTSRSTVKKLLKSQSVPIKTNWLPTQHYYNHLHFVCITSDRKRALKLRHSLKAKLLEFPVCNHIESSAIDFSPSDLDWFRTVFLPYGLKLTTLHEENLPDPSPFPIESPVPPLTPEETLKGFLHDCFRPQKQQFFNTEEVYEWYKQYLQVFYSGQKPAWTKIQFNKRLRDALPKGSYVRHHYSKKEPSLWGYKGLQFTKLPPPKEVPDTIEQNPLRDYLAHIDRYRVDFPKIPKIEISGI